MQTIYEWEMEFMLERISKIMGTVFGSIILVLGLVLLINAIIFRPMLGPIQDLTVGFTSILIGAIILYASRRAG